jgi:DEAD/DEAH box helicase domain-containing protein
LIERQTLRARLADALRVAGLEQRVAALHEQPAREPRYGTLQEPLPEKLASKLLSLGVEELFSHQAKAVSLALKRKNVVVVTGTGSGKTLCYNIPVLAECLQAAKPRAIFLYPTKALAQDQLGKLKELSPGGVTAGTYDGDTPKTHRSQIRRGADIVLTNPDMLHVGILPHHESWRPFLRNLRFVVIDEMHAYGGVFGGHVAGTLRRLLRLARWQGANPQLIACSATIGNPIDLFETLTGEEAELIAEDGAPAGHRVTALVAADEDEGGSPNTETASLLKNFIQSETRTIAFNRSRNATELVLRQTRASLPESLATKVESYRAGYSPEERREIEKSLFTGELLGLSSTSAMELGVDVGGLDVAVINGYPGSVSSFWQQSGRAGRGRRDGATVLVTHPDPLEQYLTRQPELLLERERESVAVPCENRHILAAQLQCAAFERALSEEDLQKFGARAKPIAEEMAQEEALQFSAGRYYYPAYESPASKISLRNIGGGTVTLYHDNQPLGTMEQWRALRQAHPGAVYLHRGQSYIVQSLELERSRADLVPFYDDYYTMPLVTSLVEPQMRMQDYGFAHLVALKVTTSIDGFRKLRYGGRQVVSEEPLDLPPETISTVGVQLLFGLEWAHHPNGLGGIHGSEHALLAVAPLICQAERGDLGSAWYALDPSEMKPAVYVYDTVPGGIGLAETLVDRRQTWFQKALDLAATCPCQDGCPACIQSPRCESRNEHLDKDLTLHVLRAWTDGKSPQVPDA